MEIKTTLYHIISVSRKTYGVIIDYLKETSKHALISTRMSMLYVDQPFCQTGQSFNTTHLWMLHILKRKVTDVHSEVTTDSICSANGTIGSALYLSAL